MPLATIETTQLRKIIREEMRKMVSEMVEEQFRLRMMELRLSLLPTVSDKEQKEIEELYGEPGEDDVAFFEDLRDLRAAKKAEGGKRGIPLEKVKAQLGIA